MSFTSRRGSFGTRRKSPAPRCLSFAGRCVSLTGRCKPFHSRGKVCAAGCTSFAPRCRTYSARRKRLAARCKRTTAPVPTDVTDGVQTAHGSRSSRRDETFRQAAAYVYETIFQTNVRGFSPCTSVAVPHVVKTSSSRPIESVRTHGHPRPLLPTASRAVSRRIRHANVGVSEGCSSTG
jgi:hypothetical protein